MKIVFVSGSPRKGGNTDFAVSFIISELQRVVSTAEVRLFVVRDLSIRPCRGCRKCMTLKRCVLENDDLNLVLGEVLDADLIVEAAPIFWDAPPGIMKNFIDRTHAIYARREEAPMKGKKAFILSVAADSGFETHEDIMTGWLEVYGAQVVERVRLIAREAGELEGDPEEMEKLRNFAKGILHYALERRD